MNYFLLSKTSIFVWFSPFLGGDFRHFFVFYEEKQGKIHLWAKNIDIRIIFVFLFINVIKNMIWIHSGRKKKFIDQTYLILFLQWKLKKIYHRWKIPSCRSNPKKYIFSVIFFSVFGNFTFRFYLKKHF